VTRSDQFARVWPVSFTPPIPTCGRTARKPASALMRSRLMTSDAVWPGRSSRMFVMPRAAPEASAVWSAFRYELEKRR